MPELTKDTGPQIHGSLLTHKTDVPFVICIKSPLERGYTFQELEKRNNKELQKFLDKVSRMTVQQVDTLFIRPTDKNDTYNGEQVIHYAVTESFRIHVISKNGQFQLVRLDPNHRVHK